MNSEQSSVVTPEAVAAMLIPSASLFREAYAALEESTAKVEADCKSVLETLSSISDVLDAVRGSGSGAPGGLGFVGLPIPLAARAALAPISAYVKQKTGISLNEWSDFL